MKITGIKQQVKRPDRYSIFVDDAYVFSLSQAGLLAQGLIAGQELQPSELRALKKAAGEDKAYSNALRYVAMRPRSEWETAAYLQRKQVGEATVGEILERLRDLDLLNDRSFARAWLANRRALKNMSKRRLRLELQQKHITTDIVGDVLAEDGANERDQLRELARKKRRRYPDKTKLMQYLARQGFNYDDIKAVITDEFNTPGL